MNKRILRLALVLAGLLGVQLLVTGCASTAEGIKQDYKKIEDKV